LLRLVTKEVGDDAQDESGSANVELAPNREGGFGNGPPQTWQLRSQDDSSGFAPALLTQFGDITHKANERLLNPMPVRVKTPQGRLADLRAPAMSDPATKTDECVGGHGPFDTADVYGGLDV
jgi:hypothetical protein